MLENCIPWWLYCVTTYTTQVKSSTKMNAAFELIKQTFILHLWALVFLFNVSCVYSSSSSASREPCASGATPWRPWWGPRATGAPGWEAACRPAWAEEDCRRAPANAPRAPSLWVRGRAGEWGARPGTWLMMLMQKKRMLFNPDWGFIPKGA